MARNPDIKVKVNANVEIVAIVFIIPFWIYKRVSGSFQSSVLTMCGLKIYESTGKHRRFLWINWECEHHDCREEPEPWKVDSSCDMPKARPTDAQRK